MNLLEQQLYFQKEVIPSATRVLLTECELIMGEEYKKIFDAYPREMVEGDL
jgi:hypothetical protein